MSAGRADEVRSQTADVRCQNRGRTGSSCVLASALLLAGVSLAGVGRSPVAEEWQARYVSWHKANEFRAFGSASSADLAWWESHLLQSYLGMYAATADTFWLDRLCVHADTMLAAMRDAPDSGDFWPGYRDGFLGWGTTRYDPDHRYQEYMVHDAHICLPLARFCRLVRATPDLAARFGPRAQRYFSVIETQVVAKWFGNWAAGRGDAEHLAGFGGWSRLPQNQFLAFGELLLVLSDIPGSTGLIPGSFYSNVPDSMARVLRAGMVRDSAHDCWVWSHWPHASPLMRYEDISHANPDISFALQARAHRMVFGDPDLALMARTLTRLMWDGSETDPKFSRFVDGTGGYADYTALADWLRLGDCEPDARRLVRQAYLAHPEWTAPSSTSSYRALVVANLAELASRRPDPAAQEDMTEPSDGGLGTCDSKLGTATLVVSPNPFQASTTISFSPSSPTPDPWPLTPSLRIYDPAGRCVRTLALYSLLSTPSSLSWDGTDNSGRRVPSGTYICVLEQPGFASAMPVTFLPGPR